MKQLLLAILTLVFLGCASTTKTHVIKEKDTKALDDLVSGKSFEITSQWAQPMVTNAMNQIGNAGLLPPGSNIGNIDLIGNANYVKFDGDKVLAYLPYFGERQLGGGYNNNNTGIEFEGIPTDIEVTEGKKDSYKILFSIFDKNIITENYQVTIELYPNLTSVIAITSSHRRPIRYKGRAKNIENKDEI